MSPGATRSHPVLDLLVAQWPMLVLVPAVLTLVAVLVVVTRVCDGRDERRRAAQRAWAARSAPPGRPTRAAAAPWAGRRGTVCTCSWHSDRCRDRHHTYPQPTGSARAS